MIRYFPATQIPLRLAACRTSACLDFLTALYSDFLDETKAVTDTGIAMASPIRSANRDRPEDRSVLVGRDNPGGPDRCPKAAPSDYGNVDVVARRGKRSVEALMSMTDLPMDLCYLVASDVKFTDGRDYLDETPSSPRGAVLASEAGRSSHDGV